MEELLVQYGAELLAWVENAAEFTKDQLPLFVGEIIRWGLWRNVGLALSYIMVIIALIVSGIKLSKHGLHKKADKPSWACEGDPEIGFGYTLIVVGLLLIIGVGVHLLEVVKIATAPRLYIIEQIRSLL